MEITPADRACILRLLFNLVANADAQVVYPNRLPLRLIDYTLRKDALVKRYCVQILCNVPFDKALWFKRVSCEAFLNALMDTLFELCAQGDIGPGMFLHNAPLDVALPPIFILLNAISRDYRELIKSQLLPEL